MRLVQKVPLDPLRHQPPQLYTQSGQRLLGVVDLQQQFSDTVGVVHLLSVARLINVASTSAQLRLLPALLRYT